MPWLYLDCMEGPSWAGGSSKQGKSVRVAVVMWEGEGGIREGSSRCERLAEYWASLQYNLPKNTNFFKKPHWDPAGSMAISSPSQLSTDLSILFRSSKMELRRKALARTMCRAK